MSDSANRLGKWRRIFAYWQLGTSKDKGDPEFDAVADHREATMLLRAEVNALTVLLLAKGIFTQAEFSAQITEECEHLSMAYAGLFPGLQVADSGIVMHMPLAAETLRRFKR